MKLGKVTREYKFDNSFWFQGVQYDLASEVLFGSPSPQYERIKENMEIKENNKGERKRRTIKENNKGIKNRTKENNRKHRFEAFDNSF